MEFALNYSLGAADLVRRGQIEIDRFKCPAWPDLIPTVQKIHPAYVHFPLKVGLGIGDAMDTETNQVADWRKVETLLAQTETPLVNVHLAPTVSDYPDIPADTADPAHVESLTGRMIRDVDAVVSRFGPERVIVENVHSEGGTYLRPALLPPIIRRVAEETGCGFLLDLSHARLAANDLGVGAREYIEVLPVERIREIHITGLQRFEGHWVDLMRQAGFDASVVQRFAGRLTDHLPMTKEDWEFFAWSVDQVHRGAWGRPWIVAFEYGGISPAWEAITEREVLLEQVPRLHEMVKTLAKVESEPVANMIETFARVENWADLSLHHVFDI
jgi:uncharacterized protein